MKVVLCFSVWDLRIFKFLLPSCIKSHTLYSVLYPSPCKGLNNVKKKNPQIRKYQPIVKKESIINKQMEWRERTLSLKNFLRNNFHPLQIVPHYIQIKRTILVFFLHTPRRVSHYCFCQVESCSLTLELKEGCEGD